MLVPFQELSFKSAGAAKHNMLKAKPMGQKVGLAEQWTEMEKESTWTLETRWRGKMTDAHHLCGEKICVTKA